MRTGRCGVSHQESQGGTLEEVPAAGHDLTVTGSSVCEQTRWFTGHDGTAFFSMNSSAFDLDGTLWSM
jgi:hypothetical protein